MNLDATLDLLSAAGRQARPPVFVFASSIAALGGPLSAFLSNLIPELAAGRHFDCPIAAVA